jgi:hypothetical protein
VEQLEPAEVARPEALREASGIDVSALDRGELKGFNCIRDLQTYLNDRSKKVIASSLADKTGGCAKMTRSPRFNGGT